MFDADLARAIAQLSNVTLSHERARVVAAEYSALWPGLHALATVDVGKTEPALVFKHNVQENS
jgi:hypothetical protein